MQKHFFLSLAALFISGAIFAQDPSRWKTDVEKLKELTYDHSREVVVFAGSSSIRMWDNLQDYFPGQNIVNTGFGGSQMSDLLYYYKPLILNYKPKKIFIYEGDNDIAAGESTGQIMDDTRALIEKISRDLPETHIFLIAAKPSLSRWTLKNEYEALNKQYKKLAAKTENVTFVDIWTAMLNEEGNPRKELFLEDKLHMNKKGYDVWADLIRKYLEN